MQFVLTKNKKMAAAYVILERITEDFKEIEITPGVLAKKLIIEYSIFSEKEQEELDKKYRELLETKYKQFIPNGSQKIKVFIQNEDDGLHFWIRTEKESKHLIIKVNRHGYLAIK